MTYPEGGHRIFPLGDSALTVEFSNKISVDDNRQAISLSEYFQANPFCGFVESVPAYSSTTIFYDVFKVRERWRAVPTAFEAVQNIVENVIPSLELSAGAGRKVDIPVDFGPECALDLDSISESVRLNRDEVIRIFTSRTYRVYMLGFLPGFAYMGEVDQRIAVPRLSAPRQHAPKGSVGIAGTQTGIYSLESPGGWQIIGRTDTEMFLPESDPPAHLRPGDVVRFVPKK